ncbi:MAG: cytochrome p460 [Nitrospirae bacterium]|nr:MAG: cytochrome p460 [Nitrospirota bacterium]
MKRIELLSTVVILGLIVTGMVAFADDRFSLTSPNGLSFGLIKGYENWPVVAPSYRTDNNEIRIILGNQTIMEAYRAGVPANGKAFPDGSILVKIGYSERKNKAFTAAIEPDVLRRVEYMIKDAKKFGETGGWGYARFVHDAATGTFKPYGKTADFDRECFQCHKLVKDRDFVFTGYPVR